VPLGGDRHTEAARTRRPKVAADVGGIEARPPKWKATHVEVRIDR
jgi:hypothetical protein